MLPAEADEVMRAYNALVATYGPSLPAGVREDWAADLDSLVVLVFRAALIYASLLHVPERIDRQSQQRVVDSFRE